MENKQMVHIASEVVVLLGLTFYFNQKNKKMMGHIEDLAQRLEDQEDLLQKHEQVIKNLVTFINNQQPNPVPHQQPAPTPQPQPVAKTGKNRAPVSPPSSPSPPPSPPRSTKSRKRRVPLPTPTPPPPPSSTRPRVSFQPPEPPVRRIEEILSEDDESAINEELAEEMEELR